MKADRKQIERALRAGGGETRLFLLHGPDEAGSRALAKLLAPALGPDAERIDFNGKDLKDDPARLADEAAATSLFGGRRYIIVDPAGDEAVAAAELLLDTGAAGNPVVMIAGQLRAGSKLLKLAGESPRASCCASYPPEGRDAEALVVALGREEGLIVGADVARRIADAASGNRALIVQELTKFAHMIDAEVIAPKRLELEVVELLGAAFEEADPGSVVDSAVGGDGGRLHEELLRLANEGVGGITLTRAMLRRMLALAEVRAAVDGGAPLESAIATKGRTMFWKDKKALAQQAPRWQAEAIAKCIGRLGEAERAVMAPASAGTVIIDETLFAVSRQAARRR